jgi:hypothetical protein
VHPDHSIGQPINSASVKSTLVKRFYNYSRVVDEWSKERDNLGEYVPVRQHFTFERSKRKDEVFSESITVERINGKWKVRE